MRLWHTINYNSLFNQWMDSEYLKICYYNLLEKYRCGGINEKDWERINLIGFNKL